MKYEAMVSWVVAQTGEFMGLKGQVREFDALANKLVAPGEGRSDLDGCLCMIRVGRSGLGSDGWALGRSN